MPRGSGRRAGRGTVNFVSAVADPVSARARPAWRGKLHVVGVLRRDPCRDRTDRHRRRGCGDRRCSRSTSATLLLLFGTSAAYHRLAQSERARTIMQRLDHSMIYLLIAGTYVPLCLVALPPSWGIPMLVIVGTLAADRHGAQARVLPRCPQRVVLAVHRDGMGGDRRHPGPGRQPHRSAARADRRRGLAYTIGFPVLMRRRPNPWPTTFGYHEVWHLLTVVAAALHFAAVADVVA